MTKPRKTRLLGNIRQAQNTLLDVVAGLAAALSVTMASPGTSAEAAKPPAQEQLAAAQARLGRLLALSLSERQGAGNVVLSPFGLSSALAPLYLGGSKETRAALAAVLGLAAGSGEAGELGEELNAIAALCARYGQGSEEIAWAAALWLDDDSDPYPAAAAAGKALFSVRSSVLDLAGAEAVQAINAWAAESTKGAIKQVVERLPANANLVATSALRFKGQWAEKFDPANTKPGSFTLDDGKTSQASFMSREGQFPYREQDGIAAVDLPYRGGRFSMVALIPSGKGEALQAALRREDVADWLVGKGFRSAPGAIDLPKLNLSASNDLLPHFSKIVLPQGKAKLSFPGLAASLTEISEIRQVATVTLDEEGTEAAAVTAVVTSRSADAPAPFHLRFDRPFALAIRDLESGVLLFVAVVNDPA
jgi:serine protease inhibitor